MRKVLILVLAATTLVVGATAWGSAGGSAKKDAHAMAMTPATPSELAPLVADARFATAKFATSLRRAKRAGYRTIVTQHIPDMGWHFMNPNITGFDVTRPPILVYVKRGHRWQLVAFEWVFTQRPVPDPATGCAVRLVPGGVPLRRRHVRPGAKPGQLSTPEPDLGRTIRLLASRFRHVAPLAVVPEPRRHSLGDESPHSPVQLAGDAPDGYPQA